MMGILLSLHIIMATPPFYAGMESLENVWGIVIHYEPKWGVEE
ncbi:hypothetical protein M2105_000472 [Paenibacillus sp. PastF-1]|nr:hypothetical protein [Paenibacillus sp. PastF-2]MDF9846057.1 hypothetical protein [Paenibacillus sp. PastM-2]MDF9852630.1 hypothetical protein [Paenibacillus sp. PastF-1]MDH6477639.1 hypothetical protein [Paenibacillus sp. PastH-2]MDH6505381.1 hypothetical protein [Paenibacillus sp. PastM-3]